MLRGSLACGSHRVGCVTTRSRKPSRAAAANSTSCLSCAEKCGKGTTGPAALCSQGGAVPAFTRFAIDQAWFLSARPGHYPLSFSIFGSFGRTNTNYGQCALARARGSHSEHDSMCVRENSTPLPVTGASQGLRSGVFGVRSGSGGNLPELTMERTFPLYFPPS